MLPTISNVSDTLWVKSGGKPSRMLIAKVGYDAIDGARGDRAASNRRPQTGRLADTLNGNAWRRWP